MEKKNLIYSVMLWTMFGARTMAYTCSYESAKAIADDLHDMTEDQYKVFKKCSRKPRARIMMPKRA